MELHVLPYLKSKVIVSTSFDFWMSRGGVHVDTFVLVINYLNEVWTPRHVTIGLFEVHETNSSAMVL
jgi:hypothetical protein